MRLDELLQLLVPHPQLAENLTNAELQKLLRLAHRLRGELFNVHSAPANPPTPMPSAAAPCTAVYPAHAVRFLSQALDKTPALITLALSVFKNAIEEDEGIDVGYHAAEDKLFIDDGQGEWLMYALHRFPSDKKIFPLCQLLSQYPHRAGAVRLQAARSGHLVSCRLSGPRSSLFIGAQCR